VLHAASLLAGVLDDAGNTPACIARMTQRTGRMWKEAILKYCQVRLLWQHLAGGTALWTATFGTVNTLTREDAALTQQMKHWQNDADKGRPKCSSEHLSQCHYVHRKSHTDWHEFGERPAWHKIRYTQCAYTRTDWRRLDHPGVWCRRQKVL